MLLPGHKLEASCLPASVVLSRMLTNAGFHVKEISPFGKRVLSDANVLNSDKNRLANSVGLSILKDAGRRRTTSELAACGLVIFSPGRCFIRGGHLPVLRHQMRPLGRPEVQDASVFQLLALSA